MALSGSPLDFIIAFLGGIAVSFTPCVYPLIPISAGIIGVRAGGSCLKGLAYSLLYVGGIAVTYSILGLIAGLSGSLFGRISSAPLAYIFFGMIMVIFGLSMADLFNLPLLNIGKRSSSVKDKGPLTVFFLGLSSGLIVSPCLTPVLGSILAYLAVKKQLLYGTILMFGFAYGMGFILILAGTFSGFVLGFLPKSGGWTLYIKKAFAFLIIAMGVYFIYSGIRRF